MVITTFFKKIGSVEKLSEHPLAKAIVNKIENNSLIDFNSFFVRFIPDQIIIEINKII